MAKTSTLTTRSPFDYSSNRPIYYQDMRDVAEMLNYAAGEGQPNLVSFHAGLFASGMDTIRTHNVDWPTLVATPEERYDFFVYVDPDMQSVLTTANVSVFGTATLSLDVVFGGAGYSLSYVATGTAAITQSISSNVSLIGTGWQQITIDFTRTSGLAAGRLNWFSIRGEVIAATSLPDAS